MFGFNVHVVENNLFKWQLKPRNKELLTI